ncbi:MAG: hypothetical protein V4487_00585 [Chlamydiota bacterium]
MTPRQAFASLLHLLVVFAVFSAGLFFVSLPYLPDVRMRLEICLLHRFEIFTHVGFGFLGAAFLLFLGFYGLNRGRSLRIKMGGHSAEVDAQLIHLAIEECFKTNFSKKLIFKDLKILRGAELEIGVKLSDTPEAGQEELLRKAEKELQILLRQRFGYTKPFYLIFKKS